LEKFFNGAWSMFDVLEMNFDDYELARMLAFIMRIDSPFYPQIGMLYKRHIEGWASAGRTELGLDRVVGEELQSASTVSPGTPSA